MNREEYEARALAMVRESLNKPKLDSTAAYTGSTPWDSRIEGLEDAQIYGRPNEPDLTVFRARAEGYRRAKAEDRAALEAALAHIAELHHEDGAALACETADLIRAALEAKEV